MSFAKSWQDKGCSSQAETSRVKNILTKDFDWKVKFDILVVSMATWTIEYDLKISLLLSLHINSLIRFPYKLENNCTFTGVSINILWRVTYYTVIPLGSHIIPIACFEDSLSLCKRLAILLLLVGLGDFIKKKSRKLCIYSGLEKTVNLIFLLFHKQVLYGTWVRGIAF